MAPKKIEMNLLANLLAKLIIHYQPSTSKCPILARGLQSIPNLAGTLIIQIDDTFLLYKWPYLNRF